MKGSDKRQFPRVNLRTAMRCQIRGRPHFDHAISDNISVGGISFVGNNFIAPTTAVMLEINLLSKILHPVGKIVWTQPIPHCDRNRLGIEFLELDLKEKSFLSDFITMHTQVI